MSDRVMGERQTMTRTCCIRLAMMLLVGLLGSGCSQKRDIAQYRKVLDQDKTPAPASQPGDTLSLQEALLLANQYNERVAISGENYVQALVARDQAISQFLPTLALGNTNTWQNPPIIRPPSNLDPAQAQSLAALSSSFSAIVPPARATDVPIQGQITVFDGFRNVSQFRRAGFNIHRQKSLLLDLQQTVLVDTAGAYYFVIQAEESVQVLTHSIQVQEARLQDIRAKREAGLARVLDVAQTEAQAAGTRVALIDASSNAIRGRAVLGLAVGAQAAVHSRLTDNLAIPGAVADLGLLLQQAELTRQDLVAARAAVQAAEQGVYQAFALYLPSATFSAEYFLHRESIPATSEWIRVLTANVPIFSAGQIEEGIRLAWSQLRQAKLAESLTRRSVGEQVEIAYEEFQASGQRIAELKIEVAAAAEALRQAETSFKAGLATNLDRIQAQDRELTSRLQLVVEQYRYKINYLQLLRQAGQLSTRLPGEPAGVRMIVPDEPLQSPASAPATQPE
jgi:outer membrane protein TolC